MMGGRGVSFRRRRRRSRWSAGPAPSRIVINHRDEAATGGNKTDKFRQFPTKIYLKCCKICQNCKQLCWNAISKQLSHRTSPAKTAPISLSTLSSLPSTLPSVATFKRRSIILFGGAEFGEREPASLRMHNDCLSWLAGRRGSMVRVINGGGV